MPKCQIKGCNEEAGFNPKTGKPNPVCKKHFKALSDANIDVKSILPPKQSKEKKVVTKPKKDPKPKVETFILRGNELTVNTTNRITHHKVDRFTRAVMFNEDVLDRSGNPGRYLIEIKQNGEAFKSLVYTDKQERNRDFAVLQKLLSTL